jgi:transposase InsO family protein
MSAKYACIREHTATFPVRLMCRVLEVAASGYYAAQRRPPRAWAQQDEPVLLAIRMAHRQSRQRYGAPRIRQELQATGTFVSRKRVARLMRTDGLRGQRPKRFVRTTDSRHAEPIAPNLVAQDFAPATMGGPDRVWASDITYLRTRRGWLYLAVVLDLATRRVVGWCTGTTLGEELALGALERALASRRPAPGWWHHSDRGSQFASRAYRACVAAHRGTMSMSRRGNCYDNAVVESFLATLKVELGEALEWEDARAAQRDLFEFIEVWYNRQRRHSTLGYLSPVAYEDALVRQAIAA